MQCGTSRCAVPLEGCEAANLSSVIPDMLTTLAQTQQHDAAMDSPCKHLQVIKMKEEKDRTTARTEKRTERAEGRLTAPKQL